MQIKRWMKYVLTALFIGIASGQVMAQKNIDKLVEELEKSDEVSIETVIRKDPNTRKITSMIKTLNVQDEKIGKRLIAAFEKDEEMAITIIKDIPKGEKGQGHVNEITLIFQTDKGKNTYSLEVSSNGKVSVSVIMKPKENKKTTSLMYWDKERFETQMADLDISLRETLKEIDWSNLPKGNRIIIQ